MFEYQVVYDLIIDVLHVDDLVSFLCVNYLCNVIDLQTFSKSQRYFIEEKFSTVEVSPLGYRLKFRNTRLFGELHSVHDKPSSCVEDEQYWYYLGKLHRDNDQAAVIKLNQKTWYQYGNLHREGDNPAYINIVTNVTIYCKHGKRHRDHDLPAYISPDETAWWIEGQRHRDGDKPAVILSNGSKSWFKHGLLHREDGKPAHIQPDGTPEYFYNGEQVLGFVRGDEIEWVSCINEK